MEYGYALGEEASSRRSILSVSKKPREKCHGVACPQEVYDCKAHYRDVTDGIKADLLQILEKGWRALHQYLNDIWYQSSFLAYYGERLGSSSPLS
jgi:hypothetical protein